MHNSALDQQGKLFQLGQTTLYLFIYDLSWFMLYLFTVILPKITLEIILYYNLELTKWWYMQI